MSREATVAVRPVDNVDRRKAFRLEIAKRDIPQTLKWTTVILLVFSALGLIVGRDSFALHAGDLALTPFLLVAAWYVARPSTKASVAPWIWAIAMAVIVVVLLVEILDDTHTPDMIYVMMAMTAFGPVTMSWRPFFVAGAAMVTATVIVTSTWTGDRTIDWIFGACAALASGAALLRVRLQSVAEAAEATALAERLAATDPLTGVLNRHGLESLFPSVTSASVRYRLPVNVAFVDIDGLKDANDRHGHRFGDEVIRLVASAVRRSMRDGDLVARWGGDEIVVVGVGHEWQADKLQARIESTLRRSIIEVLKWPGHISLGTATAKSRETDLEDLIRCADENMYERRRTAREAALEKTGDTVAKRQLTWREGAA